MRTRLLLAAVLSLPLSLGLAGCGPDGSTLDAVTSATVSPQVSGTAVNTFNALEVAATGYLDFCAGVPKPKPAYCAIPAVNGMVKAVHAGRGGRDKLIVLLRANQGGPIPIASYNTVMAAIDTIKAISAEYKIPTTN